MCQPGCAAPAGETGANGCSGVEVECARGEHTQRPTSILAFKRLPEGARPKEVRVGDAGALAGFHTPTGRGVPRRALLSLVCDCDGNHDPLKIKVHAAASPAAQNRPQAATALLSGRVAGRAGRSGAWRHHDPWHRRHTGELAQQGAAGRARDGRVPGGSPPGFLGAHPTTGA